MTIINTQLQIQLPATKADGSVLELADIASVLVQYGNETGVYNVGSKTVAGPFSSSVVTVDLPLGSTKAWYIVASVADTLGRVSAIGNEKAIDYRLTEPNPPIIL